MPVTISLWEGKVHFDWELGIQFIGIDSISFGPIVGNASWWRVHSRAGCSLHGLSQEKRERRGAGVPTLTPGACPHMNGRFASAPLLERFCPLSTMSWAGHPVFNRPSGDAYPDHSNDMLQARCSNISYWFVSSLPAVVWGTSPQRSARCYPWGKLGFSHLFCASLLELMPVAQEPRPLLPWPQYTPFYEVIALLEKLFLARVDEWPWHWCVIWM